MSRDGSRAADVRADGRPDSYAAGTRPRVTGPSQRDRASARRRELAPLLLLLLLGPAASCTGARAGRDRAARSCAKGPRGAPCERDEYCDFTPDLCGGAARPGTCRARPAGCEGAAEGAVCGCDGHAYPRACDAARAGVDVANEGGCGEVVAGHVSCGPYYCDVRTMYCEVVLSDVIEPPTSYRCAALPPGCDPTRAALACECLPSGMPCASFCARVDEGLGVGLRLTCRH